MACSANLLTMIRAMTGGVFDEVKAPKRAYIEEWWDHLAPSGQEDVKKTAKLSSLDRKMWSVTDWHRVMDYYVKNELGDPRGFKPPKRQAARTSRSGGSGTSKFLKVRQLVKFNGAEYRVVASSEMGPSGKARGCERYLYLERTWKNDRHIKRTAAPTPIMAWQFDDGKVRAGQTKRHPVIDIREDVRPVAESRLPTNDEVEEWWEYTDPGSQRSVMRQIGLSSQNSSKWHAQDWERVIDYYVRIEMGDPRGFDRGRNV